MLGPCSLAMADLPPPIHPVPDTALCLAWSAWSLPRRRSGHIARVVGSSSSSTELSVLYPVCCTSLGSTSCSTYTQPPHHSILQLPSAAAVAPSWCFLPAGDQAVHPAGTQRCPTITSHLLPAPPGSESLLCGSTQQCQQLCQPSAGQGTQNEMPQVGDATHVCQPTACVKPVLCFPFRIEHPRHLQCR